MIDNASLLVAIAFSSGALMVTLLISWLTARRDGYLISWAVGMGFVVVALSVLGLRTGAYDISVQMITFSSIISGLALIYIGTQQFRTGSFPVVPALALWLVGLLGTDIPMIFGQSGLGTIALNLSCAGFMALSGQQYWMGRAEAPVPLTVGAGLFHMTGISFLCCAIVLIMEGAPVLTDPPANWAETFNSIMAITGLTGLGALSLTLNQSRVTRRHRTEAQTDSMTGLLNRRALFDQFEAADLPVGTAVLMFDIDHFKQINDRQGHAAGDVVIRQFGAILRDNMASNDVVARIGGEEFCAVLQPMSVDQARIIAERIRTDLEQSPARVVFETINATVSVGVATSDADESFSSVLNRADNALYRAKHSGRNRVTTASLRLSA